MPWEETTQAIIHSQEVNTEVSRYFGNGLTISSRQWGLRNYC